MKRLFWVQTSEWLLSLGIYTDWCCTVCEYTIIGIQSVYSNEKLMLVTKKIDKWAKAGDGY